MFTTDNQYFINQSYTHETTIKKFTEELAILPAFTQLNDEAKYGRAEGPSPGLSLPNEHQHALTRIP
ncbi:MAG: hypothetical protein DHS20C18_19210 [Saprospiraceae bacterium]|nr:MAG: hypothetical protein DHS20C18_19210 [Saprospiraceae bacterium]